jgi:hypothetical protein
MPSNPMLVLILKKTEESNKARCHNDTLPAKLHE